MSNLLSAKPLQKEDWPLWQVYPVSLGSFKGTDYLIEDISSEPTSLSGLPVEFFNHELAGVDVDDKASILSFVNTWGLPHSPYFSSWEDFLSTRQKVARFPRLKEHESEFTYSIVDLSERLTSEANATKLEKRLITESLDKHYDDSYWSTSDEAGFWFSEARAVASSKFLQRNYSFTPEDGGIISLEEVKRTIINLQELTRILSYFDGLEDYGAIASRIIKDSVSKGKKTNSGFIASLVKEGRDSYDPDQPGLTETGLSPTFILQELRGWAKDASHYLEGCLWPLSNSFIELDLGGDSPEKLFSLNEALCIQFYNQLDNDVPWQECDYDRCSKYFKYQRQDSTPIYSPHKKKGQTGFCCKSHGVMYNRRINKEAQRRASLLMDGSLSVDEIKEALMVDYTEEQAERAIDKAMSEDFHLSSRS